MVCCPRSPGAWRLASGGDRGWSTPPHIHTHRGVHRGEKPAKLLLGRQLWLGRSRKHHSSLVDSLSVTEEQKERAGNTKEENHVSMQLSDLTPPGDGRIESSETHKLFFKSTPPPQPHPEHTHTQHTLHITQTRLHSTYPTHSTPHTPYHSHTHSYYTHTISLPVPSLAPG